MNWRESLAPSPPELQHLKSVSRIKHVILEKYLPPWSAILGSRYPTLTYLDCFAGPGEYESSGNRVDGSPTIAVRAGIAFAKAKPDRTLKIYLGDEDPEQVKSLNAVLGKLQPYPPNLTVKVSCQDAKTFVSELRKSLPVQQPAFLTVDPYGHPVPIPLMNEFLRLGKTEILINLMWYRISMDLANPVSTARLNELFGNEDWKTQTFMTSRGSEREKQFVEYFKSQLSCKFRFQFKIKFDPEDKNQSFATKYYLLHASNHVKAPLLMKEVMANLGDEERTFAFSATDVPILFSETPPLQDLIAILSRSFSGQRLTFDEVRERTWDRPYVEKDYRAALLELERVGDAEVLRGKSRPRTFKRTDIICFKRVN
jgi:three-Cys-motif partner protein